MAGSRRPRLPNRAGRKIPRWSRPRAAARPRARRGRRRGQARSASHRRNPGRGPPPASKYSASNHPPKAQALCQAFDIDHELDFAKREARGTIKRLAAKGKWLGDEKSGVKKGGVAGRPPRRSEPGCFPVIASGAKQSIVTKHAKRWIASLR